MRVRWSIQRKDKKCYKALDKKTLIERTFQVVNGTKLVDMETM